MRDLETLGDEALGHLAYIVTSEQPEKSPRDLAPRFVDYLADCIAAEQERRAGRTIPEPSFPQFSDEELEAAAKVCVALYVGALPENAAARAQRPLAENELAIASDLRHLFEKVASALTMLARQSQEVTH